VSHENRSAELRARDAAVVTTALYRYTDIAFARGEGVYLEDLDGRRYLDFAAGIATMSVGHCHPEVVAAITEQARTLIHAASHIGYMEPYVLLLEEVRSVSPSPLDQGKGMWVNSGSEAIETAIKMARHTTGRPIILAFLHAFHGRPMGALSCTASNVNFRKGLAGLFTGVVHAPYAYCYRCPLGHKGPETCGLACLHLVEEILRTSVHPDDLAGILVEPIAGEGGYLVPPPGFLEGLREICNRTGALFIADEVQTGVGRTGKMFAVEHWNVVPDIIAMGKAIGGGLPLGGVLARAELAERWFAGAHGTTFGGNPVSCRAGLASLRIILRERLMENAQRVGARLKERFLQAKETLPIIGDVRGIGLMLGVELVQPDGQPAVEAIKEVTQRATRYGLVITKCGASTIRICPPLTITEDQADEGAEILLRALREVSP